MQWVTLALDTKHKHLWRIWHEPCDGRRNRPCLKLENTVNLIKASLLAAAIAAAPLPANAASQFVNGTGSASASVDFQVTVPRVLFLRVGAGSDFANNTTVNLISFAPTAANLGTGAVVAGTGGDAGNGAVTAKVIGNNGAITLTATTGGALTNADNDTIPYSEIVTTPSILSSATALPAPVLANGASAPVTVNPASGKVVVRDAVWTYSYANTAVVAPGTYGGVNTNNGRVTYTASMP